MSSDEVSLASDQPLAIVVPARAEAGVEVHGVAVLEIRRRADTTHTSMSGRSNIGQAQDASIEHGISKQVSQAVISMDRLPAEDLQQLPDVPAGPVHVVVEGAGLHWGGTLVDKNLLDGKSHPGELSSGVRPGGLLIHLVNSVH